MSLPIYIPSRGRTDKIATGPLKWLPVHRHTDVHFVVLHDEKTRYERALRNAGFDAVQVLACPYDRIAPTRLCIGYHARAADQSTFLAIDDDINLVVRRTDDTHKLIPATRTDAEQMLTWVEDELTRSEHVSISPRQANHQAGAGPAPVVQYNVRTLRFLAYQTAAFLAVKHGRVEVMEDFDVNLQILRRGGRNALAHYWAQDQRMTGTEGGCSTYRTHAVQEAAARKLAELHPDFVKLVEKVNKGGGAFGTRMDVNIAWKKAAMEGQDRAV